MIIYWFVILCLFLGSFFEVSGQKNVMVARNVSFDTIVFFTIAFFLLLLTALRFETGRDWNNYINIFRKANIKTTTLEKGFVLLNLLFRNLGDKGFYLMQFLVMSLCCGIIYVNIYKNNDFPIFILLIYFILYFFSTELAQTRQHIAMAILVCGNKFIHEKKIVPWVLIVVLAMQFHITAIMAFPLYFTYRIHISKIAIIFHLFCSLFLSLFGINVVWSILNFTVNLAFLPKRVCFLLSRYMNSSEYGVQVEFSSGLGFMFRYFFYFIIAFIFALNGETKKNNNKYFATNFLIGVYFVALGRNFDQFSRIGNFYFICGNGLSFYNILPSSTRFFKKPDILRVCVVLIYCLFMVLSFYRSWMGCIEYSYKTVLFQQF